MRVFLPLLSSDLNGDIVSARSAWGVAAAPEIRGEELELLEDDAMTEAALESLILLREHSSCAHRRIVAAVDIDSTVDQLKSQGNFTETDSDSIFCCQCPEVPHSQIAAYLVDASEAEPLVKAVLEAEKQDKADQAISDLWDESLEWFDPSERDQLTAALQR